MYKCLLNTSLYCLAELTASLTMSESLTKFFCVYESVGAQWLSGRMFDSRPMDCGLEPHRRHCVVVLGQETFILA